MDISGNFTGHTETSCDGSAPLGPSGGPGVVGVSSGPVDEVRLPFACDEGWQDETSLALAVGETVGDKDDFRGYFR